MKNYFEFLDKFPQLMGKNDGPMRIIKDDTEIINWQNEQKIDLANESNNLEWADIGIVLDDPRILILRDLVQFPSGHRSGYIRIYNRAYLEEGAAGVVVLPERDGKLLLMYNFRHATRAWHWEVPRGFGEPGVKAEDQAKAELEEEIGVNPAEIELVDLGILYNNTGLEGNSINLFLGRVVSSGIVNQEIGVKELRWVTTEKFEQMIVAGEITDGFTIAAYTRAKLQKLI